MRAKDLAALAGTTVRTIRYYHQAGLLAVPDSGTTWRSYGFAHLTRLMRIRWLVESGVPLAEVPHLLTSPGSVDERSQVIDDLAAVLSSIDAKLDVLTAQRARVVTLLERVQTQGSLSPLPLSVVRLYAALDERSFTPGMAEAMRRERDLIELACYRGALPEDVAQLLDAVSEHELDETCRIWEDCQRLSVECADVLRAGMPLPSDRRARIDELARQTVELAIRANPTAAERLLDRARELDRPAVRAAVNLAYPSPVYREFFTAVLALATERSHP